MSDTSSPMLFLEGHGQVTEQYLIDNGLMTPIVKRWIAEGKKSDRFSAIFINPNVGKQVETDQHE